jgi:hypothetical protein
MFQTRRVRSALLDGLPPEHANRNRVFLLAGAVPGACPIVVLVTCRAPATVGMRSRSRLPKLSFAVVAYETGLPGSCALLGDRPISTSVALFHEPTFVVSQPSAMIKRAAPAGVQSRFLDRQIVAKIRRYVPTFFGYVEYFLITPFLQSHSVFAFCLRQANPS